MPRTVPTFLVLALAAGCGSDHEVGALRAELQEQRTQIAELQEQVEMQGERLEAQSAILARLDDARMAAAQAPVAAPEAPDWLTQEGERMVVRRADIPEPEALMRMFRAIPHRGPDGAPDGFRLSGIRRTSPLEQMGFRNGDIVHRVAGVDVSSVEGAMEAWQRVAETDRVAVQLTRRGQADTLTFEIR